MRGPALERNSDVAERGIDALASEPSCTLPSVPSTKGRKTTGGIGCEIPQKDGSSLHVGHWAFRQEDGLLAAGDFELGQTAGTWSYYYADGFKSAEGEFDRGGRTGVWDEWNDRGEHVARRTYNKGALDGVTILWGGERAVVEVWREGQRVSTEVTPEVSQEDAPSP
jgi:hypothetical protein